ncbi:MAG TPA: MlaD family protein [Anaeromyxobacteraceae bacterium]|nr:MlaD family protein [Anaeromyxobacteraceae bacterium]
MTRPQISKTLAVGTLVAVGIAAFLVAFTFFRKGGYSERESYVVYAYFDDATGLTWKSIVQIAGIQVGEVDRISLDRGRARLDLRIRNEIELHVDACVTKKFPSALLPDALLEATTGSYTKPLLKDLPPEQRQLTCVREATDVQKLLDSLAKVAEDIKVISGELADTMTGERGSVREIIQGMVKITQDLQKTVESGTDRIDSILENTDAFTGTLRDVAEKDQGRYRAIAANVEDASSRLVKLLEQVQGIVGESEPGMKQSVADVRTSIERLNRSMEHVEKVAENIGQGKGVAGKLLADERLGDKLGKSIEGVSDYVDRLVKLKVEVNLRSEWLANESGSKAYAGFKLLPRPDKFYLVELVSDPRGIDTQTSETLTTEVDGTTSVTRQTRVVNEQKLSFSLQFGRRYGPLTMRLGVIESSGGMGADLHLLRDRLTVSFNAYQFTRPNDALYPRTKLWVDYKFFKYLYATMGADDFLNRWRSGRYPGGPDFSVGRDVFFGGGVVFTDDDLKTLLSIGGSAVSSAAGSQ